MQKLDGRRGSVFSVRLTADERERLELARAGTTGPRRLGPWLVWHALRDREGSTCSSARAGTTSPESCSGTTPPAGYYPLERTSARYYRDGGAGVLPELGYYQARVLPRRRGRGTTVPGTVLPPPAERTILDLCAGSGSWSEPYAQAGYRVIRVTLPEQDVRTFVPPPNVHGVLAAPPCDQFSLARNGCEAPRDLARGMDVVNACMRLIMCASPRWWALENPVGLLSGFLGTPRDVWQPCDFGDPWTKRTAIWGHYCKPERGPFVEPGHGGGPPGAWSSSARAVTPPGFAQAFFRANP